MNTLFRLSNLFAAVLAAGLMILSTEARADATPGCGGEGQPMCTSKPAVYGGKARKVGCPSGSFFDPRKGGECWSCGGKVRTVHAVTSQSACGGHIFDGNGSKARFVGTVWGCGQGQFLDLVDGGSCWSCPSTHHRGIGHVKSAGACSINGSLVCDEGMQSKANVCEPSQEYQVRRAAEGVVRSHSGEIRRAIAFALELATRGDLAKALGGKDPRAARAIMTATGFAGSRSPAFQTISVGAVTSANVVVIGGSAETGVAIALDGARPIYWYGSTGYKVGPAASVDAGINVGLWRAQNNAIAGNSQGVVLGMSDLGKMLGAFGGSLSFKKGASVAVAVWFSYPDASGRIEFQGLTVTPTVSAGVDFGGYVKAVTVQVP